MSETPREPSPSGYDEVRQKLLERGYLHGRIERFVLADLAAPGERTRGFVRAAGKASVLGGPALGALLAGTALSVNRPGLSAGDALVLWGYFAILSAAALFVLGLTAAALTASRAGRRGARPADTRRAGLLVAVPTLAYLLVLWWARRQGSGAGLPADLLFLAASLSITLLVAWLSGLVSLAGVVGRTGEVPDRARHPAVGAAVVLVPLAALLFVAPRDSLRDRAAEIPSAPFVPAAVPERIVFVGIDGLDGTLVEALSGRGAVDGILSLLARGAVWPKTRAAGPEPPEVWTTILTGMPADAHGVRSVGATRLPGVGAPLAENVSPLPLAAALKFVLPARTVPATGAARRVRTLPEILGLHEPVAAVGWWASWPATATSGYVVSDRVLAKLLSGAAADRDTWPPSLYARLASDFPAEREGMRRRFDEGAGGDVPEALRSIVRESALIDGFALSTLDRLLADPAVRAGFVYLPGLDILRARIESSERGPVVARALETQQAIESYVRWLDREVASRWVEDPSPVRVALVADPGRTALPRSEGFVAIAGGRERRGCVGGSLGDLDVAPLVLDLAGYPASREMPGSLPSTCLSPGDRPTPVSSFGRRPVDPSESRSDYDPEMVERLKSLGYLR